MDCRYGSRWWHVNGGKIIAEGNPEKVSQIEKSYTGNFLEKALLTINLKKLLSKKVKNGIVIHGFNITIII